MLIQNLLFFAVQIMPFQRRNSFQLQNSPVFPFYLLSTDKFLLFNEQMSITK